MVTNDVVEWVRMLGSEWIPLYGDEGPRRKGHCVYCAGQCALATKQCSVRVFSESDEDLEKRSK